MEDSQSIQDGQITIYSVQINRNGTFVFISLNDAKQD